VSTRKANRENTLEGPTPRTRGSNQKTGVPMISASSNRPVEIQNRVNDSSAGQWSAFYSNRLSPIPARAESLDGSEI